MRIIGSRPADLGLADSAAGAGQPAVADQVTLLYRMHGVLCALFRNWDRLADPGNALPYVRSAVMNRCRTELRRRIRLERRADQYHRPLDAESPEEAAILGEEHREVLAALSRLPHRQREALALRYFLNLPEAEIATAMGISQGTVKSTTSRALAALGRSLKERS